MSLQDVQSRIAAAAQKHGRTPSDIELLAVSKVQPLERIEVVLEQGHKSFGENRVQEAQGKWPDLKKRFEGVKLHLIGPLQTNKALSLIHI